MLKKMSAAAAAAGLMVLAGAQAAWAGGGPGGGVIGGVTCGQAYTPSCVVSAGSPGSPAASAAGPKGTGSHGAAGISGCVRSLATVACPLPAAGHPRGGRAGAVAPGALGLLARRYLVLPRPVILSSPPPGALQLVALPLWLWVARAVWAPRSQTATVPGEQVTATATPVSLTWHMGDGAIVVCHGPGTPYTSRYSPAAASPDCGHTYTRSSAGQPGGAYHVTVTITWAITWHTATGAGGSLPPLFSTARAALRVGESQAVNTTGGAR
jgi:hypothetical protein